MNGATAPLGFKARVIRRHMPASGDAQSARTDTSPPQNADSVSEAQAEATRIIAAAQAEAKAFVEHAQMKQAEAYSAFVQSTHLEMSRELLTFRMRLQHEVGQTRVTLARIVRSSCEKIIGAMNASDKALDLILDQAMRTYAKGGAIIVRVAPADKEAALAVAERFGAANNGVSVHIADDATMPEGQCRLENGDIAIDLGLKPQLDLLETLLARTDEPHRQEDPEDPEDQGDQEAGKQESGDQAAQETMKPEAAKQDAVTA